MGTKQECSVLFWTNPGSSTPLNSSCMATNFLSQKPSKTDKTCRALLEKQRWNCKQWSSMNSYSWMYQCWPTGKDLLRSVLSRHWTCWEQWMMGKAGESMDFLESLWVWLDDDDDNVYIYPTHPPIGRCDTRSVFKQSTTSLNLELSISIKEHSLPYYLEGE